MTANTSVINTDPIRVNSPSVLAKVGQLRVQEAAGEVLKGEEVGAGPATPSILPPASLKS